MNPAGLLNLCKIWDAGEQSSRDLVLTDRRHFAGDKIGVLPEGVVSCQELTSAATIEASFSPHQRCKTEPDITTQEGHLSTDSRLQPEGRMVMSLVYT